MSQPLKPPGILPDQQPPRSALELASGVSNLAAGAGTLTLCWPRSHRGSSQ